MEREVAISNIFSPPKQLPDSGVSLLGSRAVEQSSSRAVEQSSSRAVEQSVVC